LIERLSRSDESRLRWLAYYTGRLTDEQRARLADDPDPELAAKSRELGPLCGSGGHIVAAGPQCGIRVHIRECFALC
jgi:hypothetical protein